MLVTIVACNFVNTLNPFSANAPEMQATAGFQTIFPITPQAAATIPHVDITFQANPSISPTSVILTPTLDPMYVPPDMGPEEFVRFYYDEIDKRNYVLTWSLLTPGFISMANPPSQGGYQGYVNWWNTVDRVDVTSVDIVTQSQDSATLIIRANYYYRNGVTTQSRQRFHLTFDASRHTWLFDK